MASEFCSNTARAISAAETDPKRQTLYWMAAETGLRAGELCGLQWPDVKQGYVDVVRSVWRGAKQSVRLRQEYGASLSRLSFRSVCRICGSNPATCSTRRTE